ncbi:MAG: stage II sporulation protein P [Bacilli bacterium]
MKKRFITKKKIKSSLLKLIFLFFICITSFVLTFKVLYDKINIDINNESYINFLVNDSLGYYNIGDILSLKSTDFLLKYSLGIEKTSNLVSNEVNSNIDIPDKELNTVKKPTVYIYNTHQGEEYKSNFLESFNINNTVYIASFILKEYLSDLGISSLVEENKIMDVLNTNGWKYNSSYKASRILLDSAYKNNPTLKYFFDIHRDSSPYDRTVTDISGVKYAKLMFVIGLEHPNYASNLKMAERINELLKSVNVSLSRGIMKKEGPGVNGIYNQDFSEHSILIEVGGQYNSIEEINNTLKVLSKVIFEYITEVENAQKET